MALESIQTNWYVLTGAPSSGKTKTLEYLAFLGHPIVPKAARVWIDAEMSRGKTISQIRKNESSFQSKVWELKLTCEDRIDPQRLTFLDRGLPDTTAYSQANNHYLFPTKQILNKRRYQGVFLLESLEFQQDYARIEDQLFGERLHKLLHEAYLEAGYPVVIVPRMPIDERAEFILSHIR